MKGVNKNVIGFRRIKATAEAELRKYNLFGQSLNLVKPEAPIVLRQKAAAFDSLQEQYNQLSLLNNAKDDFISIASHQLRTPATGVKQYTTMLLDGFAGELSKDQRKLLERVNESNDRQLRIIDNLLLVARLEAGKVSLTLGLHDLAQIIRDVVQEQQGILSAKNQKVELMLPKSLKVLMDPMYLRMVIENLVNNASKYSYENSPITILAKRKFKKVIIKIIDRGVGISKKDQEELFQKFSRINNLHSSKVGGSGLGLYWAKKIIDMHKGKLQIISSMDKGSTFMVILPSQAEQLSLLNL